jgi:preprotein translocase subunit SecA
VHILTFNDYCKAGCRVDGPVYNFLGLTTGYIREACQIPTKKKAYCADITYVTARKLDLTISGVHMHQKRRIVAKTV